MGSSSLLIIGDDWQDQIDRYAEMECTDPLSPHIFHRNSLSIAHQEYANATSTIIRLEDGREFSSFAELDNETASHPGRLLNKGEQTIQLISTPFNGAIPFNEWTKNRYDYLKVLSPGEEPDLKDKHRYGWMILNEVGDIVELITREKKYESHFYYFQGTWGGFLLKPDTAGWEIDNMGKEIPASGGIAGRARFSDIDFAAMRERQIEMIGAPWDIVHHVTRGETWHTFEQIRQKHLADKQSNAEVDNTAYQAWLNQPPIRKLRSHPDIRNGASDFLDLMLLPKVEYVARHIHNSEIINSCDVILHGEYLSTPDVTKLLTELNEDVFLTLGSVKC